MVVITIGPDANVRRDYAEPEISASLCDERIIILGVLILAFCVFARS